MELSQTMTLFLNNALKFIVSWGQSDVGMRNTWRKSVFSVTQSITQLHGSVCVAHGQINPAVFETWSLFQTQPLFPLTSIIAAAEEMLGGHTSGSGSTSGLPRWLLECDVSRHAETDLLIPLDRTSLKSRSSAVNPFPRLNPPVWTSEKMPRNGY